MSEPVDDVCAQIGCLDNGICFREGRWADSPLNDPAFPPSCHRRTAMLAGAPARPYSLRLGLWRAFLRRVGLTRLLPTEPYRG